MLRDRVLLVCWPCEIIPSLKTIRLNVAEQLSREAFHQALIAREDLHRALQQPGQQSGASRRAGQPVKLPPPKLELYDRSGGLVITSRRVDFLQVIVECGAFHSRHLGGEGFVALRFFQKTGKVGLLKSEFGFCVGEV